MSLAELLDPLIEQLRGYSWTIAGAVVLAGLAGLALMTMTRR